MFQSLVSRKSHRCHLSSSNLLIREIPNIRLLFGVFYGHADQVSVLIKLDQDVFGEILGLNNFLIGEVDKQSVGVVKIFDVHIQKMRKKGTARRAPTADC